MRGVGDSDLIYIRFCYFGRLMINLSPAHLLPFQKQLNKSFSFLIDLSPAIGHLSHKSRQITE